MADDADLATSPFAAAPQRPAPAAARWQLRLLGAFELQHAAQPAATRLPGRAAMALLARLALWPQRQHARETLVELLWPGVALDVGRNRLRQTLSTLKSTLEADGGPPALQADRVGLRLLPGALACDVAAFEQAVRAGDAARADTLYRGELMPGFYDEWIGDERARLAALHERSGPVHRPAGALPSAAAGPTLATPLPSYLTPAFGTAEPVARLLQRLARGERLLTLQGPGGSGKTRLAVELARRVAGAADGGDTPRFDLVAFVPLVACTAAAQMADAVLSAVGAPGGAAASPAALAGLLEGRRVLLVLDNLEQFAEVAAPVLAGWTAGLPGLHLLLTSRRALGLDGERVVPLAPLPLPSADADLASLARNPAVALLVDRAQAVRADFRLQPHDRDAVVALVQRLEGMPLAIELAAPRLRSLSAAELAALLAPPVLLPAGRMPRLALLARAGRGDGLAARHASMQAVIDWSWRQLEPAQQRLAGALASFHGGCTLAALRHVNDGDPATALQLDELHAQSMVHARTPGATAADGALRFQLYEPVREFATARLGDVELRDWRARHRAWARAWAAALPATPSLPELRAELPNIDAALASAVADGVPAEAIALVLPLRRALEDIELPAHALAQAEAAVAACTDPLLRARGCTLLGPLLFVAGRGDAALAHARQGVQALPHDADPLLHARALHALARVTWRSLRDGNAALPLIDRAEALLPPGRDPELAAGLLALRAFVLHGHLQRPDDAMRLHRQALGLWRTLGNEHAVNSARYNLAAVTQSAGRHAEALQTLAEVLDSAAAQQDWRRLSQALNVYGNALSELRRWPEAVTAFRECLRIAWRHVAPHDLAYGLWNLPRALAHTREPEAALRIAAFAARFWETRFGALGRGDLHDLRRVRRLAAVQLGSLAAADEALAQGAHLALPEAIALALGRGG